MPSNYCPLTLSTDNLASCLEVNCAWWNQDRKTCAVAQIANIFQKMADDEDDTRRKIEANTHGD